MKKIISEIKNEMEKQGLTTPRLLLRLGISEEKEVRKVNRLLAGDTKRPDLDLVGRLRGALGMVADQTPGYGVPTSLQSLDLTPMDLKILEQIRGLTEEQKRAVEDNIQDYKLLQELKSERKKANG